MVKKESFSELKLISEKSTIKEIEAQDLKGQAEFRKYSKKERGEKEKDVKRSKTTLVYRNMRRNPDIFWLILFCVCVFTGGYFFARIKLGWSAASINIELKDYLYALTTFAIAVIAAFSKLITNRGPLSDSMKRGFKNFFQRADRSDIDEWGRTIITKEE